MDVQIIIIVVAFFAMLLMNVPVAIAIGGAAFMAILSLGDVSTGYIVAQKMSAGIAKFSLLAIPFFVLAGQLMGEGGMARRLIDFASVLVGHLQGGLAYVCTLTCMLFGAISGSATAAVSSVGGMMLPEMQRNGYDRDTSVALTTTAATTGLMIPPSNVMIVFAVVAGDVSVASLFLAGIGPGILTGLLLMLACWITGFRGDEHEGVRASLDDIIRAAWAAFPSLLLIVIVMGGILGGVFSPTEAAAIAVLYAFLLTFVIYREAPLSALPQMLLKAGITTSVIFLLIGASQAMSWVLVYQNIPQTISATMLSLSDNPLVILLIINLVLLVVGAFMDMTPAVLIFTPIFLPVVTELGMDPVHFGIMIIVNLCIGLCTPPVGTCLFIGCGVGQTTIAKVARPMIPFFIAMVVALLIITYVPQLSLWLPEVLGP
ncbi:Sialic acid TRAP transporter permease protein SiaT [Posidoniimonas polymericola]|uniref:Sialic acid TRAP transporter permease protein SiaT n=1 Tax=Posidoniimonas polymericola TaxID=2528002 RepID=A0A5C5YQQ0_9BACT|nr:TRAP transporter large permease [Posidoniimonas polymericola]TWT77080.1 Sialic acid TRAP transporter permease protein SiaT [Posidoniimonas polymericola]